MGLPDDRERVQAGVAVRVLAASVTAFFGYLLVFAAVQGGDYARNPWKGMEGPRAAPKPAGGRA